MIPIALLSAAALLGSAGAADTPEDDLTSRPTGPGLTWTARTDYQPLPHRASQAKRRRKARRAGRRP